MKTKKTILYPNNLEYNEEKRFFPAGLWYDRLHIPTDDELSALNLSRDDGKFVFLQRGAFTGAYITKSAYSNRYFLNMASPIMREKKLIADVHKEKDGWKGNYYYGEHMVVTTELNKDAEYISLLSELFNDAETLISYNKKNSLFRSIMRLFN